MLSPSYTTPAEPSESPPSPKPSPTQWLDDALTAAAADLPEHAEGYLLGRGVLETAIEELGLGVWRTPDTPCPIPSFAQRYGEYGEKIEGHLVTPLRDGRGGLLGFEARSMEEKAVSQFKLTRAFWNPVFLGLHRAMPKIWAGGDVWIGEGLFDMTALDHVIPERDAAIAALTANLNRHQVEFLRRFLRGMAHMVFDRDQKGRKATTGWVDDEGKKHWGAIESLDRVHVRCRDVYYHCPPGCKDPGDLWERYGEDGLRNAFGIII